MKRANHTKRPQTGNQANRMKEESNHPSGIKSSKDYRGANDNVGEDMVESRNEAQTFQKNETEPTPFD